MANKIVFGTTDITPIKTDTSYTNGDLLVKNNKIYQATPEGELKLFQSKNASDRPGYATRPTVSREKECMYYFTNDSKAKPAFERVPNDKITYTFNNADYFRHMVITAYRPSVTSDIYFLFLECMLDRAFPTYTMTLIENVKIDGRGFKSIATGPAWAWPNHRHIGVLQARTGFNDVLWGDYDTGSGVLTSGDNIRGYVCGMLE